MNTESAKLEIRDGVFYMILGTPNGEVWMVAPKRSVLRYGVHIDGPGAEYDPVFFDGEIRETGMSIDPVVLSLARHWASGAFEEFTEGQSIPVPAYDQADAEQWIWVGENMSKTI